MTTYTARTPADLIALAPYVLGFHPEDSVVLMTFGGSDTFHARIDLPTHVDDQHTVCELLRNAVAEHEVRTVCILVYSDDVAAAATMAELLVCAFLTDEVGVIDVLRVEEDAYYDCVDPTAPGTPYDLSTHPFTASGVYEGRVAHDSRAALADTLVGTDEDDRDAVHRAAERFADAVLDTDRADSLRRGAGQWVTTQSDWLEQRVQRWVDGDHRPLSAAEAGRMLVLLSQEMFRAAAWAMADRDGSRAHVDLWSDLVRRSPESLLPGPAALLAFTAWLAGDGALAWCAIDRCTAVEPDDSLAAFVGDLLVRAVSPATWADVRRSCA